MQNQLDINKSDINKLENDIHSLHEIAQDTNSILLQQNERLDILESDVEQTLEITKTSEKNVNEVLKLTKNQSFIKPVMGGLIGILIMGPLGLTFGLTGVSLSALCSAGALVGIHRYKT